MFQAVPPPIIRSSKLYTQHRVFVELLLLLAACVSDLGLVCVCCCLNTLKMHGPMKVKFILGVEAKKKFNVVNTLRGKL
jgi:hypothetical protein